MFETGFLGIFSFEFFFFFLINDVVRRFFFFFLFESPSV